MVEEGKPDGGIFLYGRRLALKRKTGGDLQPKMFYANHMGIQERENSRQLEECAEAQRRRRVSCGGSPEPRSTQEGGGRDRAKRRGDQKVGKGKTY